MCTETILNPTNRKTVQMPSDFVRKAEISLSTSILVSMMKGHEPLSYYHTLNTSVVHQPCGAKKSPTFIYDMVTYRFS